MTSANRISRRLSTTAFILAVIAALSPHVKAQEPPQVHVGGATITGLPSDWSHHHVIYGNPGTEQDAIKNGTHEQWLKVVNDPRYIVQNLKRGLPVQGPAAQDVEMRQKIADQEGRDHRDGGDRERGRREHHGGQPLPPTSAVLDRDWSMNMKAATAASASSSFSGEPTSGNALTITGNGNTLVLSETNATGSGTCTIGGTTSTGSFKRNANASTDAADLVALITATNCGSFVGVTATNPGAPSANFTITATTGGPSGNLITVQAPAAFALTSNPWTTATDLSGGLSVSGPAGTFPAKYSISSASSVNCSGAAKPDYVVYPTSTAGSASSATIIAYDNLYASCTGTVPMVYWAYNTGTGSVVTSPIISYDGTQVAFIETPASGAAVLRILKFAASAGTDYSAPFTFASNSFTNGVAGAGGNTAWTGCAAGFVHDQRALPNRSGQPGHQFVAIL